jgi:hypothetical protein
MTIKVTFFWYVTPCSLDLCDFGIGSSHRLVWERLNFGRFKGQKYFFFKIYCRESIHSMFKDKLQNCSLNTLE